MYDFYIEKKISEALLEIFLVCKRFYTVKTNRIHLPKIFIFFFHMLYGGSSKPTFGWYKVTFKIYEATTTKIHGQRAPKLGS